MDHVVAISKPFAASGLIVPGTTIYYDGISVRETAGAVASVRVRQGAITGAIVAAVSLPANGSFTEALGLAPINCDGGVYVEVVAGTVEGSVRYI
jgi:hypothetical protein